MTKEKIQQLLFVIVFAALSIFFVVALIFWTIVPYFQLSYYLRNASAKDLQKIAQTPRVFSPYSAAQVFIRKNFLLSLSHQNINQSNWPMFNQAIASMEELVTHKPFAPYDYVLLANAYAMTARFNNDQNLLQKAERYYQKALELSPKQQKLYYAYGAFLFDEHRDQEALNWFQQALDLDQRAPVSNFYFALGLMTQGEGNFNKVLEHFEVFFNSPDAKDFAPDFPNPDPGWVRSKDVYKKLLRYFYEQKDVERVLKVTTRLIQIDSGQAGAYKQIVDTINKTGQLPVIEFQ